MRTNVRVVLGLLVVTLGSACSGDGGGGGGGPFRGFVSAGLARDAAFGDNFEGSAAFLSKGIGDNGFLEGVDGDCGDIGEDLGSSVGFQDAGDTVDISTDGGTLVLDTFLFPGLYASFTGGDASMWSMGGTVTFTAPGGSGVDGFERTFPLSGALTLTTPDPAGDALLDRNADFTLAWTSSGTTDPIFVSIEQENDNFDTVFSLTCRFDDDGSGVVPASFLGDLSTAANITSYVSISKERITILTDIPGLGGDLVADGSVSYDLGATVQD
jgi:hypothetical protein